MISGLPGEAQHPLKGLPEGATCAATIRPLDFDWKTYDEKDMPKYFGRLEQYKSKEDDDEIAFYKSQSFHSLGSSRCDVDVVVQNSVHSKWHQPLKKAIAEINFAAPGLNLIFCRENSYVWNKKNRRINVYHQGSGCWTYRNLLNASTVPEINLDPDWSES